MARKYPLFRAKSQQIEWVLCMVTTVLLVVAKLCFAQSCSRKLVKENLHQHIFGLLVLNLFSVMTEKNVSRARLYAERNAKSCGVAMGSLTLPWVMFSGLQWCSGDDGASFSLCGSMILSSFSALLYLEGMRLWATRVLGARSQDPFYQYSVLCSGGMIYAFLVFISESWTVELLLGGCSIVVLHSVMLNAPFTFTMGEGIALSTGIVHVVRETIGLLLWDDVDTYSMPVAVFILSTTGLSTVIFLTLFFLHKMYTKLRVRISPRGSAIESSLVFLFSMGIVSLAAVYLLHQNAAWMIDHILQDATRVKILAYWVVLLSISLPLMKVLSRQQFVPQTILRKGFHFIAILIFVPSLVLDSGLLGMSLSVAMSAFLLLELLRVSNTPGISEHIHNFMSSFTDNRDNGAFFVTHITLLLGLAIPIWLSEPWVHDTAHSLTPYAGVIATGVGDAAASIFGKRYGKRRITTDGDKTLQGMLASIMSMLISWPALSAIITIDSSQLGPVQFLWIFIATVLTSSFEAITDQFDNIFISMHYFALLQCL